MEIISKEAVIFDVGGVILTDTDPLFYKDICRAYNITLDEAMNGLEGLLPEYQKGRLSSLEFWTAYSEKVMKSLPSNYDDLLTRACIEFKQDQNVLDLIRRMGHVGYKTAYLSNTCLPGARTMRSWRGFVDLVNAVIFSCEVGLRKPNAAIYGYTMVQLGITDPRKCVYIDNISVNLVAPAELGMNVIHFENYNQVPANAERLELELGRLGIDF